MIALVADTKLIMMFALIGTIIVLSRFGEKPTRREDCK